MINTTPAKVIEPSPSNDEVVLSVEGVSKKFCRDLKRSLFYGVQDIAGELTGVRQKSDRLRSKEFWALDNVSFQLRKGEALGLVGKNGSGKSTLLRIIAGLIKPDLGTVKVTGRVAPLIALGAGFNPILTGRENIYANMSILGLSTKEIDERFDDVVEFAEIGDAIDAPVQSYSSGMAARLGFASAIHTEPDILLIDEVLAVGDIRFQEKCFRQLSLLLNQGTSFILVSHHSQAILLATKIAVYLDKGHLKQQGKTADIIRNYENYLLTNSSDQSVDRSQKKQIGLKENIPKHKDINFKIQNVFFRSFDNSLLVHPTTGENIYFCIQYFSMNTIVDSGVILEINKLDSGNSLTLFISSYNDNKILLLPDGCHEIRIQLLSLGLIPGSYTARAVVRKENLYTLDFIEKYEFFVKSNYVTSKASYFQQHSWEIQNLSKQSTDIK